MRYLLIILISFVFHSALAQISIDYPYQNQIFQRNQNNSATVSFLGKTAKEATKVEYQLIPIQNGKEQPTSWKILDSSAIGGFYQAKLNITGGLYKFKVRSYNQTILLDSATLNRFGVGEVFVIAGQSNAQGVDRVAAISGTSNEMVISANFNNRIEPHDSDTFTFIGLNNLDYPTNKFEVLTSRSIIGPTGYSNFFWPSLGDKISSTLNVPVCFFNVGWSGSSIRNWAESSRGIATKNPWIDAYYPAGFPFENLKQIAKLFAGSNGFRAVLWQIGETDSRQRMPSADFIQYFKEVQTALTRLTGVNIPMVLAQSTYTGKVENGVCVPFNDNNSIKDAINSLWLMPNQNFITGPNTDLIEIPRQPTLVEDCVHFSPYSFPVVADAWYQSLKSYFDLNKPVFQALNFPILDKFCGTNNSNNLKLNDKSFSLLKDGNEIKSDSLGVFANQTGSQFKWVYSKDTLLKFESPSFQVTNYPIPVAPVISATGPLLFCDGKQVELSSNVLPALWNTQVNTKTITVARSGDFTAFTQNRFQCVSKLSNTLSVKVFDNPKAPTITQTTPYFLYGGIKLFDIDYKWSYNNQLLTNSDVFLKVNKSGIYQLYAAKTYNSSVTCNSPIVEYAYTLPNDGGMTTFPNPVGPFGKLTIESVSNLNNAYYQLVDVSGRTMKEGNMNNSDSFSLDVNNIPVGKYILSIITTDNIIYKKSIIIGK